MQQILLGSLALSILHAAIPNHWLPLVAIARAENWNRGRALRVTALAGAAHTASTIAIGIIVGAAGFTLSRQYEATMRLLAPTVLVGLGSIYLLRGWGGRGHAHVHLAEPRPPRSTRGIVASLALAMFFSPCLEIEAFYLTAALQGWWAIGAVSIVYFVVTVAGMVTLVAAGMVGAGRLRFHGLEHHARVMTGALLIVLGVGTYLLS